MARSQESLASLLSKFVEASPVAQSLGLIHITKVAEAFGMHRATIQNEVRRGFLNPIRFRGGAYFSRQSILEWWATYQERPYHRGPGVRARSKKAHLYEGGAVRQKMVRASLANLQTGVKA
jgi:hypothetical protein